MPGPQPRASVSQIPAYVAGKPPQPRPGLTTYKLSSNENPYPPLPGVLDAAVRAAEQMNRYPDMGNAALYAALSEKLGVPTDELALATGSVALIYQVVQAFCEPGDQVVYAWRSFEAYPIAVTVAGAASVAVPVLPDGRHDLDAMAAAVTDRTRVVLVCTPNNPTGPSVTQTELDAFLAQVPDHVLVVVDEAYLEFVRMADPVDGLATVRTHPNVVSTRTFSKAYGLAGFRVGYAVAPAAIAGALRAVSLPFGVSHVAQAAAVASLAAEPALLERVDALVGERERVLKGLADAGVGVPDAQGNFVWFATGDRTAEFAAAADDLGIVVRPFAGEGARVSVGEPEANDRVIELARRFHPAP
jgi:histidinol-phosphate aminotransferase